MVYVIFIDQLFTSYIFIIYITARIIDCSFNRYRWTVLENQLVFCITGYNNGNLQIVFFFS